VPSKPRIYMKPISKNGRPNMSNKLVEPIN
jgi:hypothetical protein